MRILKHNQNAQNDGKSSAFKQLLETLFFAIKICTGFATDSICMNAMCSVSLASHLKAVAGRFHPLRSHHSLLWDWPLIADELLMRRNASALRWLASDTAHPVFTYIPYVVKPVYIFMSLNRVSRNCLIEKLCFNRFLHLDCVLIYIFGFHHKQCASN